MYSQDEKDKMAMKNSTIDKFAAKRGCPEGQVPDGKGGCRDVTMKEKMEKTNKRDKEFYDEMGPVPKGFTRAKFKPSFSDEILNPKSKK